MRISTVRHPEYKDDENDFFKWRLCYKGGRHFIDTYLIRFSRREDNEAFKERRRMSYAPTFAKAAINKLKNTFYSRMGEIKRLGGPDSYKTAIAGDGPGVDLFGSSMNAYIGQEVLEELMAMRRVGVYVDRKPLTGPLLSDNKNNQPYLYLYKTEDILTWNYIYQDGEYVYRNVLLRDYENEIDDKTGMVIGQYCRYRQVWLADDGLVHIQFWIEAVTKDNEEPEQDIPDGAEIITELDRIPFVYAGLKESLLADVADYQIAMLNIASADVNYVYRANFPFYTEEFDPLAEGIYNRRPPPGMPNRDPAQHGRLIPDPNDGTEARTRNSADDEISVGAMRGRRFPKGAQRPEFIAPPTEPLLASMKKQEQMKNDIFELVDIAASQAQPQHASADSKQMDNQGLESGLSYIGLELEYLENEVAKIWGMYEGKPPAVVNYPEKYTLKSDAERVDEATKLNGIKSSVPSRTFAKEVGKQINVIMLKDKVPDETIAKINAEIDAAEYVSSDPALIQIASELGMVDAETGSDALGFIGAKVVPKAQKEHADRLAEIAKSQAGPPGNARGNPDGGPIKGKDAESKAGNGQGA